MYYFQFQCLMIVYLGCYVSALQQPATECSAGWVQLSSFCFLIRSENVSWAIAWRTCRNHNSYLMDESTSEEQDFFREILPKYNIQDWWMNFTEHLESKPDEPSASQVISNSINLTSNSCNYLRVVRQSEILFENDNCRAAKGILCKQSISSSKENLSFSSCQKNEISYQGYCYWIIRQEMNWFESEQLCEAQGGKLASLGSREKNFAIYTMIAEEEKRVWIGIGNNTNVSLAEDTSNINGRGNHSDHEPLCIAVDRSGKLVAISCENNGTSALCEKQSQIVDPTVTPTVGISATKEVQGCPDSWKQYIEPFCYQVSQERASWETARLHCVNQGGDLASFSRKEEEIAVFSSSDIQINNYWIGLIQHKTKGLKWSDSSSVFYTSWWRGLPDEIEDDLKCVAYSKTTGAWLRFRCSSMYFYVCQALPGKIRTGITKPSIQNAEPCTVGEPRWKFFRNNCYFFWGQGKDERRLVTWNEAQLFCQQQEAELASILSSEENDFLFQQSSLLPMEEVWLGLRRTFSLKERGEFQWSDSYRLNFINWSAKQPDDFIGNEDCGLMYTWTGEWSDEECTLKAGFICKKPNYTLPVSTGICMPGWKAFGSSCYKISKYYEEWDKALASCEHFGAGCSLASIHSKLEQAFLTGMMGDDIKTLWIGLNKTNFNRWTDGSEVSFINWGRQEPSSNEKFHSVGMLWFKAGQWFLQPKTKMYQYVCKCPSFLTLNVTVIDPESQCPGKADYSVHKNRCYKVVKEAKSWTEAEQQCQTDGGHLTSVLDVYEKAFLQVLTYDLSESFWIGLSGYTDLEDHRYFSDGWFLRISQWSVDQPKQQSDCVLSSPQTGQWKTEPCNQTHPFVCKYRYKSEVIPVLPKYVRGTCPNKEWVDFGTEHCYLVSNLLTDWKQAALQCTRAGSELASIHSDYENLRILQLIQSRSEVGEIEYFGVWIGLQHTAVVGRFVWSDKTNVDYLNWGLYEPSSTDFRCVFADGASGKWMDFRCSYNIPYICKTKKVVEPTTVNPTSTFSTDSSTEASTLLILSTSPNEINFTTLDTTSNKITSEVPRIHKPIEKEVAPSMNCTVTSSVSGGAISGMIFGCFFVAVLGTVLVIYVFKIRMKNKLIKKDKFSFDNDLYTPHNENLQMNIKEQENEQAKDEQV